MSRPLSRRPDSILADILDALASLGVLLLFALIVGSIGLAATILAVILQIAGAF